MKTKIFTLLIITIPLLSFTQSNSSIDFIIGIESSYRTIDSDDPDFLFLLDLRNERELAKTNWRVGFNYNKRLFPKFYIKSGVRLASVGYKDKKMDGLRWPSEIGPEGYVNDPTLPDELQAYTDYWFIEVPLALRYEFSARKISPFIEMGISPSYYLTTRTKIVTDLDSNVNSMRGFNSDFSNVHMVGVAAIGTNFNMNDQFQLFGQGTYRYHFTRLVEAPVSEHLYNYGVELGVRMMMK